MGKKKNKKEHCHCLSSFGRFCFFIGKSQQCSKQLHEYTDCFWQLPINKDWAGSIPTWPSPWEFLVLYKPFFITENTHASPHSSGWLLLREGARCGMGSVEGWLRALQDWEGHNEPSPYTSCPLSSFSDASARMARAWRCMRQHSSAVSLCFSEPFTAPASETPGSTMPYH